MGGLGKGGRTVCLQQIVLRGLGKGVVWELRVDSRLCWVDWVKGVGFWIDSTLCLRD